MTLADRIIVLNAGRIEQTGASSEIYHNPASIFVASFMGPPPTNLIEAQTEQEQVQINGYDGIMPAPKSAIGPVTLGIRPEDIELDSQGTVPFRVDILEELGAHRLQHGAIGGQLLTVMVGKDHTARIGETHITLKPDALRLFDVEAGKVL